MGSFPEDVRRIMQLCENALRESVSAGQLVHHKELVTTITSVRETLFGGCEESASGFHMKDMTYSEWFCRIVDLLDLSCEGTEIKTASVELSSLLEASFELNSKDAQAVHRIANLLFFKCFLFRWRVLAGEGNPIYEEKISTMFRKWNQDSSCESILARWKECDVEISELAKKMLFEWTHSVLEEIRSTCENRMGIWQLKGNYVEAASLGDKYNDFLEEYNRCLDPDETSDIQFLYNEIYVSYAFTAKLHLRLGKYVQAQKLCDKLLRLFNKLEDFVDEMKIPIRREGKTVYIEPSVTPILCRQLETLVIMIDSLRAQNKSAAAYVDQRSRKKSKLKELRPDDEIVEYFPEDRPHPHGSQLIGMENLIRAGRYSEAEKAFERYKEETAYEASLCPDSLNVRLSSMRNWLEFYYLGMSCAQLELSVEEQGLPLDQLNINMKRLPAFLNYSSSEWQALCRKYELVLDMAEFARDPILTAEFVKQYGGLIGERSLYKIKSKGVDDKDSANADKLKLSQDYAAKLERWLKEELGLPITTTEDVQEVALLSCFSEPCCPSEHKKHLPPMLKSCRLLKWFMDTNSRLLHNWTMGSADEAGWLKLLESLKSAHSVLQENLLHISKYCLQFMEIRDMLEKNGLRQNSSSHDRVYREMYDASAKSTLVWAERGRGRSLLHQLKSAYLDLGKYRNVLDLREELINFDLNEQRATSSILSSCCFASETAVFVEYILAKTYDSAVFVMHRGPGDKEHVEVRSQSVQFKCDGNRVAQLVGDFYKAVTPIKGKVEYDEQEVAGYLEELFDMLIRPIWSAVATGLRSKSTLVFVPDKILNRVPFALLRDRNSKKYLFELHPISVAPSVRVLQHCKRRLTYLESCPLKPGKSVVAIGGASYEETQLLPGSAKEVTELAERFPGRVYKLEKCDATSANLLALLEESAMSKEKHAFGLMHLGVHCHWDDTYKTGAIQFAKPSKSDKISNHGPTTGTPNCSFPALEQEAVASTSRDGKGLQSAFGEVGVVTRDCSFKFSTPNRGKEMIQSEDIIANGLQWPTSLVVLSACNSSKGEVFGDGEVNLPRALMIAGVPATLVAQWKVVDRASPELMRVFYDSLQRGQDVATALRSSMLHALRVHKSNSASKIHEWGPFVVWGLPSVQLPKELWTEDPKKALAEPHLQDTSDKMHLIMSNMLKLQRFLASIDNDCTFENASVIYDAISAALELFGVCLMQASTFPPIEQVFVKVPLEHLHKFEVLLEASDPEQLYYFRWCMRYAQAIQGRFQLALDYANALIGDQSSRYHLLHRQERAVVLRLLGRHGEALKEFDDLLEPGFDYECQIERSCVKYQMGDKDGALEDARHAEHMCPARPEQLMLVLLSFHAIPPEFRAWISKVCSTSQLRNRLLVPAPCNSSFISTGDGEGGSGSDMDPNLDSELDLALRVSVEKEPARRAEAAMKRSVEDSATKELQTGEASIARDVPTSDAGLVEITDKSITDPTIDEDTALLEQALAMSMTGIPTAESGGDDQDLAYALQMSMQEQC